MGFDPFMNLVLDNAVEAGSNAPLGRVVIRGNSVVEVSPRCPRHGPALHAPGLSSRGPPRPAGSPCSVGDLAGGAVAAKQGAGGGSGRR